MHISYTDYIMGKKKQPSDLCHVYYSSSFLTSLYYPLCALKQQWNEIIFNKVCIGKPATTAMNQDVHAGG